MTIIARLADGEHSGPVRIAAFMHGNLLDLSGPENNEEGTSDLHYLTVQADGRTNNIYFEIYDLQGKYLGTAAETVQWGHDEILGTLEAPFELHLARPKEDAMTIAPNPFSDHFTILIEAEKAAIADATLYNPNGRLIERRSFVLHKAGRQFLEWNGLKSGHASLPSGTYLLKVTTDNKTYQQLVVKQ